MTESDSVFGRFGRSGQWCTITQGPDQDIVQNYDVTFFFGVPLVDIHRAVKAEYDIETLQSHVGDSPFRFPGVKPNSNPELTISFWRLKQTKKCRLYLNGHSRLASATVFDVEGEANQLAVNLAGEYLLPHFDMLAFEHGVGYQITCIVTVGRTDGTRSIFYYRVHRPVELSIEQLTSGTKESAWPFISGFREALSATSPYYQAILLAKLAEWLEKHQQELGFDLLSFSNKVIQKKERYPGRFIGKTYREFLIGLKNEYRHTFAHLSNDFYKRPNMGGAAVVHIPSRMGGFIEAAKVAPLAFDVVKEMIDLVVSRPEIDRSGDPVHDTDNSEQQ